MSEAADPTPAADPAPAADPVVADATLVTDPAPSDPPAADPADAPAETAEASTDTEGGNDEDGDSTDNEGAPEEYAEFTMPEGVELDPALTDKFKATAKELNLSQDKAQKLVELAAEMRQRDAETIVNMRQEWIDQTKADPEIGGAKLNDTLAAAKRGLNAYGTPQFIELLNQSGLGNHPEVVRVMARAGRAVSEDKVVTGGGSTGPRHHDIASKMFPTANKE